MNNPYKCISVLLVIVCMFAPSVHAETTVDLHENIRGLLEMTLQDFPHYEIVGNDSGYIIRIASDGFGLSAMLTSIGLQTRANWKDNIDSVIEWANSISEFIKVCGVENPNLLVIVVDEFSYDETILAIYNGKVIFDFAPAK